MRIWIILLLIFSLPFVSSPAMAKKKKEKSYAMSMKVFKKLESAQQLSEEDNYAEAFEVLEQLLEKRMTKYERAQVHNLTGSLHYRNGDQDASLQSFVKVLESAGSMPSRLHQQTLKTLSQLYMAKDDFETAKDYCEELVAVAEEPSAFDYALLAQAYYKLEQWQKALEAAQKGRDVSYANQEDPNENLLLLINASHFELGQLDKMPGVLDELIRIYPKKSYVLYLASIYGQLDRLDKQTVLMESLYDDGKLTENNQLRNLASLYMSEKAPYKGAVLLEKALSDGTINASARDYELLAQAWRLAAERQKATEALQIAAELSDDGDNYLRKAYLHFDMAQWQEATHAILSALDKGLDDKLTGEAWLLLGMSRFQLKQFNRAIEACERAVEFEKSRDHAEQWITYISKEKQKRDSMMPNRTPTEG